MSLAFVVLAAASITCVGLPQAAERTASPARAEVTVDVITPFPPSEYVLPTGALHIASSAALIAALAGTTPRDIVLADGIYDNTRPFLNPNGHRLYAEHLGGAVLRAGISVGGNSGPGRALVRGLAFDVSDPAKTEQNSIVHVWGTGAGSRILDSTFNGNRAIGAAIVALQVDGLVVQRVRVRDFTSYGVFADSYPLTSLVLTTPVLLEDLDVAGVSRAIPKSAGGTAEACVWLGNTGTVRRALMRNCAWMGLWTGSGSRDSLFEHLDIDSTMVGIYAEHYTYRATFRYMKIGSSVREGIVCEWNNPLTGGLPACEDNTFEDGEIGSYRTGAFLDVGTARVVMRRIKFVNQCWAAIADNRGVNNSLEWATLDTTGIDSTARALRINEDVNTANCQ